jgi:hypothetical protein
VLKINQKILNDDRKTFPQTLFTPQGVVKLKSLIQSQEKDLIYYEN